MGDAPVAQEKPRFRRRKILVQPGYQLRVAATILVIIFAYSLLLGFLVFYPLHLQFSSVTSREEQFWFAREIIDLHKRFWPSVLVVGVLVAIQSIFVTHRVVGPAYHLRRIIEGFTAGRFDMRAHLRRWDRLKELEAAVNTLGEALLRRKNVEQECLARLQGAAAVLKGGLSGSTPAPQVQEAVEEIGRVAGDLAREE
jgi:HAMP domain-containing protein